MTQIFSVSTRKQINNVKKKIYARVLRKSVKYIQIIKQCEVTNCIYTKACCLNTSVLEIKVLVKHA